MLRNQAFLCDSLEVISDWRLLYYFYYFEILSQCSKRICKHVSTSLFQAFGQDKEN